MKLPRVVDFIRFALCILFSLMIAAVAIPFFIFDKSWGQKFHHWFGQGCLWIMGIKVTVIGRENLPVGGGAILAPNHESIFDIPVLASIGYDLCWLAKTQVGMIPFIGWVMKVMGCYFVRRDRSGHDLNIMKEVEDGIRHGASVVVFPEGTRTRSGSLLPFKKGVFRSAENTLAPVIPIAITGTYQIAPPGELPSCGHQVFCRIGPPLFFPPGEPLEEAQKRLREKLIKLLSEDRGSAYNGSN